MVESCDIVKSDGDFRLTLSNVRGRPTDINLHHSGSGRSTDILDRIELRPVERNRVDKAVLGREDRRVGQHAADRARRHRSRQLPARIMGNVGPELEPGLRRHDRRHAARKLSLRVLNPSEEVSIAAQRRRR